MIVNGDAFPITSDWFGLSGYPWNILIDPDMKIISIENQHTTVFELAKSIGDESGGCVDGLASNFGEDEDCLYEGNNFTSFQMDVLPVLDFWGCTSCHNEDLGTFAADLKMHNYESIMAGSNSGSIIVPGSENSILLNVLNQVDNATSFTDMWGTTFDSNSTINKNLISRISSWIIEGAIEFTSYGCLDDMACNYDENATVDDSSCQYNDECGICNGNNSSCLDCAGVPNGNAFIDYCSDCAGGSTNIAPCDLEVAWNQSSIQAFYYFTTASMHGVT